MAFDLAEKKLAVIGTTIGKCVAKASSLAVVYPAKEAVHLLPAVVIKAIRENGEKGELKDVERWSTPMERPSLVNLEMVSHLFRVKIVSSSI